MFGADLSFPLKELGCLESVWKAYGTHMYDLHRILAISCEAPLVRNIKEPPG